MRVADSVHVLARVNMFTKVTKINNIMQSRKLLYD